MSLSAPQGACAAPLDPAVLDGLYRRYKGLVRRRVRRFYAPQEAADVVAEVFERVARQGAAFRGDGQWSTWLYQVTTRHCLNRLRDSRRRQELFDGTVCLGWETPGADVDAEARVLLGQLWRSIAPELVTVAIYYFVDGMSQADIGEVLGVSDRTISTRLTRFRAAARQAVGEEP